MNLTRVTNNFFLSAKICFCLIAFLSVINNTFAQDVGQNYILKGNIVSGISTDRAGFVSLSLKNNKNSFTAVSNSNGEYIFKLIPAGTYTLTVSSISWKTYTTEVKISYNKLLNIKLEPLQRLLDDIYVTASEAKGKSSTSVIDQKAMQLLQPSSFTDLLELLPGGRSIDPRLTAVNLIQLRTPASKTTVDDMSALGTAFYIDGAPIGTTANLQTTNGFTTTDPNTSRNSVNRGVDMRSISTDQIEKVEIVRGIASVEYGDLTSGLVKIERKKGATPFTARIKADGFSKLFSVGKGVSITEQNLLINVNADFLDSKSDPRDNFENYKRISGSIRTEKFWEKPNNIFTWSAALDYSTTIDNQKTDPDNSYALTDNYSSKNTSYGLTNTFNFKFKNNKLFKDFEILTRVNYQNEVIDLTKWVQARSATILVNSLVEGAYDANYITPSYAAKLDVRGNPVNVFLKAKTTLGFNTGNIVHRINSGLEYNFSKNFGDGQIYDLNYPLNINAVSTVRPRAFNAIPAVQNISFYVEDGLEYNLGANTINLNAGVRGMAMLGLDRKYSIANKPYLDPRLNFIWNFPKQIINGKTLEFSLGAGYGLQTKLPTMDMLNPNYNYIDNVQLNFYHNNPEFRIANAMTSIINPVNYSLAPATNKKFEINAEASYNGNRLSITYFRENMASGFNTFSNYKAISYRKYDNTSVNASTITEKPKVTDFTYTNVKEFYGYNVNSNGGNTQKEGIEYQFTSKRIASINTRFTLNGAWMRNKYANSQPAYSIISTSVVTNNNVRQYVGLYQVDEGNSYQQFNTNLIVDSYLPKLGLMLSASVQSLWFTKRKQNYDSGTPISYMDINQNSYPYTAESYADGDLRWLQKTNTEETFREYRVPMDLMVNIKASKTFKNNTRISMFVNRFLTYLPDYESFGNTVSRQGASPYFGMEININL